jgi:hypothetical protein
MVALQLECSLEGIQAFALLAQCTGQLAQHLPRSTLPSVARHQGFTGLGLWSA